MNNKNIGGFIEDDYKQQSHIDTFHDCLALTTGRACIAYIIKHTNVSKIHVPYYICDSVLQPIVDYNIDYSFYNLNSKLEIKKFPDLLHSNELLLYVNYFGLKHKYIIKLEKKFSKQLIIDNSQSFYQKKYISCWSFNSARKFFGVTDGAFIYQPKTITPNNYERAKYSTTYLIQKQLKNDQIAYKEFLLHEKYLTHKIQLISKYSLSILQRIDYNITARIRLKNFNYLHKNLFSYNLLDVSFLNPQVPLYYPLLIKNRVRNKMISRGLFVPLLWKEVLTRDRSNYKWEKFLASNLVLLPIDQRYNTKDMDILLNILMRLLK